MLVRLIYASRVASQVDQTLLHEILGQSRRNNEANGITGLLCASPDTGTFLQALEGGRRQVNTLYAKIIGDSRHREVTLVDYSDIEERCFGNWRMGSVDLSKVNRTSILKYSATAQLDPLTMTARSALVFLEEIATGAAVVSDAVREPLANSARHTAEAARPEFHKADILSYPTGHNPLRSQD